jgi:hypothetical protein
MVLDSAVDHGFTQTRRASDKKAASRHLPPGSGDVGLDEGACPVHEVRDKLVLHPRGHRPAVEARGRTAVGVDRGPAAKAMTDPVYPGHLCQSPESRRGLADGPRATGGYQRSYDTDTAIVTELGCRPQSSPLKPHRADWHCKRLVLGGEAPDGRRAVTR